MALRSTVTVLIGCAVLALGLSASGASGDDDFAGHRHRQRFTLTVAVVGDGDTNPGAGSHVFPAGTRVTVRAVTQSGSTFLGWSGAVTTTSAPVTIVMDGDKTVTAQFSWGRSARSDLPNVPKRGVPRPHGRPGDLKVLDWAGFRGAVSYTLDDSQPSHVEHYAELQATGIRMTFYVNEDTAANDLQVWQQIVADGHEVANHTLDHCRAPTAATPQLNSCAFGPAQPNAPAGATPDTEIDQNSAWIESELGADGVWTMATPYGDGNWDAFARPRFLVNRGVHQGMVAPNDHSDPFDLPCYMAGATQDGGIDASPATFNQLIDTARATDQWMTFLFHSILPTQANWYGAVDISSIVASIDHVKALQDVWVDPMVSVGAYWRAQALFDATTPVVRGPVTTWRWTLPPNFPPGQFLRVTVRGGELLQGAKRLIWDEHGYYEVALDKGTLTLIP